MRKKVSKELFQMERKRNASHMSRLSSEPVFSSPVFNLLDKKQTYQLMIYSVQVRST